MPSKTPATSVRLPPGLRPVLKAYAEDHTMSEHAAILRLIKIGLERDHRAVNTPARAFLAQAEAKAAHLAKPKRRARWSLNVPLASDVHAPYGSRLKATKAKK